MITLHSELAQQLLNLERMMFDSKEGQRVPDVTFRARENNEWLDLSSNDLFAGKSVILFSLPGAFTPTCSSSHVPRFNQLARTFKEHGIDDVICMSVNDAFVMNEWKQTQEAGEVTFIPDGNGTFTETMGLLVDKENLGFGKRSWRYSMLVRDGIIEKMFIEPDEPGDPFYVSDADTMLNYIAPGSAAPLDITVFSRPGCPHCERAKNSLRNAGLDYESLELNKDYTDRTLRAVSSAKTVPQVFVNGECIGGANDLDRWLAERHVKAA
jgi:glutaredoxin-like protein